ncbi:MAG: YceI family protein [Verrucomicrobia bacterium]|nr:YceI family protein [Verrucomicrobiota bacterium]
MKLLLTLTLFSGLALQVSATPISFDFADPKGVNTISFNLDGPLESISGTAKGVSGRVQFDPKAPENTTGTIDLDVSSLHVGNPRMKGHLHGPQWMDVAKHPDIQFKVARLNNVETTGNITSADIVGEITVKGVTRAVTAKTTLTYLKGKLKARMGPRGQDGDLLVIRTKFSIFRNDFGISAGQSNEKVANEIEISMSIAGQAPY